MNSEQSDQTPTGKNMKLPAPDPDNITVLTNKLPNEPILPWNRYDSPWQEQEEEAEEVAQDEETGGDEEATEVEEDAEDEDEPQLGHA